MRRIVPLMAVALLGGCGVIPPVIGIASYALDGMSLIASGRTVTDHAISAAAQQDCKLFRAVQNLEVCTEWGTEPQMAAAPELRNHFDRDDASSWQAQAPTQVARLDPARAPADRGVAMELPTELADVAQALPGVAKVDPVPQVATALVAPVKPVVPSSKRVMTALVPSAPPPAIAAAPAPVPAPTVAAAVRVDDLQSRRDAVRAAYQGRYLMVLGSFKSPDMAGRMAKLYQAYGAQVVKADVYGQTYYRVVVQPEKASRLAPKLPYGEKPWPMPAGQGQPLQFASTLR